MSDPRVLVAGEPKRGAGSRVEMGPGEGWRWIGWFGLTLVVAGLGDLVLAWVPLRLGSPEWEFGTVASSVAALPLFTIGMAAMLGSAVARGIRWQQVTLAWVLVVWSLLVVSAYVLFLLDVPVALRSVEGSARLGIQKAIGKTTIVAVVFTLAYLVAAVKVLRAVGRSDKGA